MLILKRKDVEISSVQHPKQDQKIPILNYQGQTFRLLSVFAANQEEEAVSFWRDLTDNHGKFCILLEEPERYSVWGRIRNKQSDNNTRDHNQNITSLTQACLLLLQTVYTDIEDLLGNRQAKLFEKDIIKIFKQWNFPQADSPATIEQWLSDDPLETLQIPPWQEHHLITLLQELYRIGTEYFGNSTFASEVRDILQDMSSDDLNQFMNWLQKSSLGKLWR